MISIGWMRSPVGLVSLSCPPPGPVAAGRPRRSPVRAVVAADTFAPDHGPVLRQRLQLTSHHE